MDILGIKAASANLTKDLPAEIKEIFEDLDVEGQKMVTLLDALLTKHETQISTLLVQHEDRIASKVQALLDGKKLAGTFSVQLENK